MSYLGHRFASPAEFKQELIAAFGSTASVPMPPPWDPALLRRVEVALARHIGPIASVLVRRSAPTCLDVPTLCERLAELVTDTGDRPERASVPLETAPGLIPASLVSASARVLAGFLGPIAPVVARRAAATAPDRAAYFGTLEEAIADPQQRHAVRTMLDKLH